MDDIDTSGAGAELHHPAGQPHLLQEVMRTSQALLRVFTQQVGIPASQLALLRLLAIAHPEALGVMELARETGVNAAAITRQVRELDGRGLIARVADPRDARRNAVALTAEGLQAFLKLHARGHEFESALGAEVSDEDLATAVRVLGQLRSALEALR